MRKVLVIVKEIIGEYFTWFEYWNKCEKVLFSVVTGCVFR